MTKKFNQLILTSADKKKKGGSLGAVFKLIQDLTDFEEKIQDCVDAQEVVQNKEQIEEFLQDIDKMYETLLTIAKGGIQSLRSERAINVDEVDSVEEIQEVDEIQEEEHHTMTIDEALDRGREVDVPSVKKPIAPRM